MSDLISRNELVKLLEDRKREHYENYESFRNYMGNRRLEHETEYEECKRILTIVANKPTVEAVPVVRCKNCKYFCSNYPNVLNADGLCENTDTLTDKEDFCSHGASMTE